MSFIVTVVSVYTVSIHVFF